MICKLEESVVHRAPTCLPASYVRTAHLKRRYTGPALDRTLSAALEHRLSPVRGLPCAAHRQVRHLLRRRHYQHLVVSECMLQPYFWEAHMSLPDGG